MALFSIIVLLFGILIALPFMKKYILNKRIASYIDKLPGDKWYPIVGTSWHILRSSNENMFDFLMDRHSRLGPVFRSWYGNIPVVNIYKPEHTQIIFRSASAINKGFFYKFLREWLGEGLVTGSGSKWKEHRRIITPSFHFNILDAYGQVFAEKGEMLAQYLSQFSGKGYFEVSNILTEVSLDIITETAMGVTLNLLQRNDSKGLQYARAIINYTATMYQRCFNMIYANDFLFRFTKVGKKCRASCDLIRNFNHLVVQSRKEQLLQEHRDPLDETDGFGRKKKLSFLDLLLKYQQTDGLTDQEIEDEVSTFMFTGSDTTAATMTYTLLMLGNRPNILKRVQEELDDIFADDPERKVTPQDLTKMTYMEMVINEVLRCYTIVPVIHRELQEDIEIEGHKIPKGVIVVISLYNVHHDPEHYPEPFKFDPDRFLPENVAKRHPYAFVPFSAGPRTCMGRKFGMRNVKTLLACLLRKFDVTCKEKPETIKNYVEIVIRPQNGLHIGLEPRRR